MYNRCKDIHKFGNKYLTSAYKTQVKFSHIFRGKKCVLWSEKYGNLHKQDGQKYTVTDSYNVYSSSAIIIAQYQFTLRKCFYGDFMAIYVAGTIKCTEVFNKVPDILPDCNQVLISLTDFIKSPI